MQGQGARRDAAHPSHQESVVPARVPHPCPRRSASRWRGAAPAVLALALLAGPAGTAAQATTTGSTDGAVSMQTTGCTFTPQFTVPYAANQQGLAYADGLHYVGFDMGSGNGRIIAYDDQGREVKRTPLLPLGHASEVSYRAADGNLYVSVYGGGAPLKVAVVDMRPATPRVVRTYDFGYLGTLGMVAVDNSRDHLVVKSGPREGPHTFTTTDMSGRVLSQFTDVSQGLGQGLEVVGDDILLYTSAPYHASNTITVYSREGVVRSKIHVPVAVEGQGLSVNRVTGQLHVGFKDHVVRRMSPLYTPTSPAAPANLLVNSGAEASEGSTSNAVTVPLASWSTTGGMTALRYGTSGYPKTTSPGPADRGRVFFSGGTTTTATATQTVSTSDLAPVVDGAGATYELSGWLGGYGTQADGVRVVATFRDAAGTALGSAGIGPVTAADRAGVTGMLRRSATGSVPVGTRTVRVVATATRVGGTNNDGYADSISLTVR